MKTTNAFRHILAAALLMLSVSVFAQQRPHQDKQRQDKPTKNTSHVDKKAPAHVSQKHLAPTAHVYAYHTTPRVVYSTPAPAVRYVYYRDYDVYFDHVKNGYYTFNGRRWIFSTTRPSIIRHVDLARTPHVVEVYHHDDFGRHLNTIRPMGRPVRR
jgi:hypothetical protein